MKHVLHNIGNSFKSIEHSGLHVVNKVVDLPGHAIDKIGNVSQNIAGELGLPLLIIGGIVAIAYLRNA
jgi:hypothetical protein